MPFNIFAALATGVFSLVLGFIWYGPLFSKPWSEEVGISRKDMEKGPGIGYLLAFVSSTFMGAVTSYLVIRFGVTDLMQGLLIGVLFALGYVATTFATNYIFARKTIRLYSIDAGYQTLLVVAATLIAVLVR